MLRTVGLTKKPLPFIVPWRFLTSEIFQDASDRRLDQETFAFHGAMAFLSFSEQKNLRPSAGGYFFSCSPGILHCQKLRRFMVPWFLVHHRASSHGTMVSQLNSASSELLEGRYPPQFLLPTKVSQLQGVIIPSRTMVQETNIGFFAFLTNFSQVCLPVKF